MSTREQEFQARLAEIQTALDRFQSAAINADARVTAAEAKAEELTNELGATRQDLEEFAAENRDLKATLAQLRQELECRGEAGS